MDDFDDFDDILDDLLDDEVDPTDDEDEMFDNTEEVTEHVDEDDDSLDAAMGMDDEPMASTPVKPMVDDVPKKETFAATTSSTPATVATIETASPLSSVSSVPSSSQQRSTPAPLTSLLSTTRSESPMRDATREDRKSRLEALRQRKAALHGKSTTPAPAPVATTAVAPAPSPSVPSSVTTKPVSTITTTAAPVPPKKVATKPKTAAAAPRPKPTPAPKPAPAPKVTSRPKLAPKPAPKPKVAVSRPKSTPRQKAATPKISPPSSYKPRGPTRPIHMSVANRPTKAWLAKQGLLPGQSSDKEIGQQKRPGDWLSKTNVKRPKLYHNANISVSSIPNRPTKAFLARMAATQEKMARKDEAPTFSSGMLQTPNGQTFVYRGGRYGNSNNGNNNMNPQRRH